MNEIKTIPGNDKAWRQIVTGLKETQSNAEGSSALYHTTNENEAIECPETQTPRITVEPKQRKEITYIRTKSEVRMTSLEIRTAQSILVDLLARAYAIEHRELFGPYLDRVLEVDANDN